MWVMYGEGDVWWGSCMIANMYGGSIRTCMMGMMYGGVMYGGDDVSWG